ncbi:hypothetical protein K3831_19330 [Escherichia coli]|nr:hypothetical protein [Escherichia coli]QZA05796.1 hypothetical protein K3831_19330 [Escherichia coli]
MRLALAGEVQGGRLHVLPCADEIDPGIPEDASASLAELLNAGLGGSDNE